MAGATEPFPLVYSPINSLEGEIRLLRVKEAVFRTDIVECDLITASLDQCKDFIALSYCWGSNQQNEVLLCNGKSRHITASLHAALKAFRESENTRGSLLWADAVSIDQHNDAEKSGQIPLMGRIYSEAKACFVYLGRGEPRVTQGLDLMIRLSVLQTYLDHHDENVFIPTNALFTLLPKRGHPCWLEYWRIFMSPWFGRTWTLQEIALSKRALLGIGRYVQTWDPIENSLRFLIEHHLPTKVGPYPTGADLQFMNFMSIREIRKQRPSLNPSTALIKLLQATRHFKVTDPRDKIYAILGLFGELPDGLKITVDYKLSAGEVFHGAALYMCKVGWPNPVFLLAHAGLQRQSGRWDMPSWVPDWSSDDTACNARPLLVFRPESFAAGLGPCVFRIEAGEFFTMGFCHHRITQASKPYANTETSTDPMFFDSKVCYAWLDSARQCIESSGPLVYDDAEEAVARTLLVDDLYDGGNAAAFMTAIQNPKMTFRAAMAEIDRAKRSNDPERAFDGLFKKDAVNNPVQTFIMQMTSAMIGRRFAITDRGYTCLVPACTEVGDAVAVFSGHPTPFTIRMKPGSEMSETGAERVHAQLIGDTYMHGVMYCEMLIEARKSGRPPCEIVLI